MFCLLVASCSSLFSLLNVEAMLVEEEVEVFKIRLKTRHRQQHIKMPPTRRNERRSNRRKEEELASCCKNMLANNSNKFETKSKTFIAFNCYLYLSTCTCFLLLLSSIPQQTSSMLMMTTNCLSQTPACSCSWKSGKFVADCSSQSLNQVPKNDYYDYLLANAGNNQMPTLNRDIQQLNLASNVITELKNDEFSRKKFRNLQKIYLNSNRLTKIDSNAFYKLTGLIELDLSENSISSLDNEASDKAGDNLDVEESFNIEDERTTKNKSFIIKRTNSFLEDLVQLRQLNLTSNKLSRIGRFTFSPLTQLRQLYLSRNKISFIDKKAFDGLNVLNILYLDGNKLSNLNGEILVKLPALHAIKLASGNRWRCDCKLRNLVRLFVGAEKELISSKHQFDRAKTSTTTTTTVTTTQRQNILQDEPRCASTGSGTKIADSSAAESDVDSVKASIGPREGQTRNSEQEEEEEGKSWKNMKLDEFECVPSAATEFMSLGATSTSSTLLPAKTNLNWLPNQTNNNGIVSPEATQEAVSKLSNHNHNVGPNQREEARPKETLLELERGHYLPNEPLELTCAFHLNDELDLDLSQVEWWQLELEGNKKTSQAKNKLLWRVNGSEPQQQPQRQEQQLRRPMKDEAASLNEPHREEYAIIDYVTRANGSSIEEEEENENENENEDGDESEPANWSQSRVATQAQAQAQAQFQGRPRKKLEENSWSVSSSRKSPSGSERSKLVRVLHLIVNPLTADSTTLHQTGSSKQNTQETLSQNKLYLCRITNKLGRLDIVYPININQDSDLTRLGAAKRQALRRKFAAKTSAQWSSFSEQPLEHSQQWSPAQIEAFQAILAPTQPSDSSFLSGFNQERAKYLIAQELNNRNSTTLEGALFIPLHLPEELIYNQQRNSQQAQEVVREFSLARSLQAQAQTQNQNQNQDHQRTTATRQTNGTNVLVSPSSSSSLSYSTTLSQAQAQAQAQVPTTTALNGSQAQPEQRLENGKLVERKHEPSKTTRRSLNSIAFDLIGRYTSNKKSLIFGNDREEFGDSNDLESSNSFPSNWDNSKPPQSLLEVYQAKNKPFSEKLKLASKLLVPERMLNFVSLSKQNIFLVLLMLSSVTITVCLTRLCRRDRVADSSPSLKEKETKKSLRKRRERKSSRGGRKSPPSVSAVETEPEQEQLSPPSGSLKDENMRDDKFTSSQSQGREAQLRPESGSATTTTNGSQAKLLGTSSDESQLQIASEFHPGTGSNGNSTSATFGQLDASMLLHRANGELKEKTNKKQKVVPAGDSSCQSDEMNLELENEDPTGTLEVDLEHHRLVSSSFSGSSQASRKLNQKIKQQQQHRLIVVSPQEELQELTVSPSYYYASPDEDHFANLQQQQQAPNSQELSSDSSSLIQQNCFTGYHLSCVNNLAQYQEKTLPLNYQQVSIECGHPSASQANAGFQYDKGSMWATSASCQDAAAEDLSSSLLLTGSSEQFQNLRLQQQQQLGQFLVAPPPKLRSIKESLLLPYVNSTLMNNNNNNNLICANLDTQLGIGSQQQQQQHQMTLPARRGPTMRVSPNYLAHSNRQVNSSIASPASTSSSLTAATTNQPSQLFDRQAQLGLNQNIVYLDYALQLLDSSVNDCFMNDYKHNNKNQL